MSIKGTTRQRAYYQLYTQAKRMIEDDSIGYKRYTFNGMHTCANANNKSKHTDQAQALIAEPAAATRSRLYVYGRGRGR